MAGSQSGVLDTNQGNESKVAKTTTNQPKAVDSNQQAGIGSVLLKIAKWAWKNRKVIGTVIGTLFSDKALSFIQSIVSPKGTEEYKSLTATGKKSIDNLSTSMLQAYERGDKTAFVDAIKESAKVYEQQASMTMDPSTKAKLLARSEQLSKVANGIENGTIPMDSEFSSRIKSDSKDSTADTEKNTSIELMNKSLGKDLRNILQTTLDLLNVPELDDKNAQAVAQKMLTLGADTKVAEQILTAYYENVKGLSHEDSEAKAKGIVSDAVKANENPQAKENEAGKESEKQQKKQVDQGMSA
jgi:hypothetical protein